MSDHSRRVAVGRKLPQHKTLYIQYATKDEAWRPQPDPRADPDLRDLDDVLKERAETRDVEDMPW